MINLKYFVLSHSSCYYEIRECDTLLRNIAIPYFQYHDVAFRLVFSK